MRPYLSTDDLVALAGKTPDYWARLCKSGVLAAVKLGNEWRVERTVFEAFMRPSSPATPERRTARQRRKRRT